MIVLSLRSITCLFQTGRCIATRHSIEFPHEREGLWKELTLECQIYSGDLKIRPSDFTVLNPNSPAGIIYREGIGFSGRGNLGHILPGEPNDRNRRE